MTASVPSPPLPVGEEAARLLALAPYQQLAAGHNPVFTQVAQLAARLFGVPMAQVSLVGADEVTYPGNVGDPQLPACLNRADTICAVTILHPEAPTVFPDLPAHPCPGLSEQAQAGLGFYAGAPLLTRSGAAIGSLCVLDCAPRAFGPAERALLQQLAGITMRLLDLELLAGPGQAPGTWAALESRVLLGLQRIETLLALARLRQPAPAAPAALHAERQLILQDIEYQVAASFEQLGQA